MSSERSVEQISPIGLSPRKSNRLFEHYAKSRNDQEKGLIVFDFYISDVFKLKVSIVWENVDYNVILKDPKLSKPLQSVYKIKRVLRY